MSEEAPPYLAGPQEGEYMPPKQRHRFILRTLEEKEVDKRELAAMCGVSVRTIDRDFQTLQSDPEYVWLECRLVWRKRKVSL